MSLPWTTRGPLTQQPRVFTTSSKQLLLVAALLLDVLKIIDPLSSQFQTTNAAFASIRPLVKTAVKVTVTFVSLKLHFSKHSNNSDLTLFWINLLLYMKILMFQCLENLKEKPGTNELLVCYNIREHGDYQSVQLELSDHTEKEVSNLRQVYLDKVNMAEC